MKATTTVYESGFKILGVMRKTGRVELSSSSGMCLATWRGNIKGEGSVVLTSLQETDLEAILALGKQWKARMT